MNDSTILSELIYTVDELNKVRNINSNNYNNNNNFNNNNNNNNNNNLLKEYHKLQQYIKILENDKEQILLANKHLENKNSLKTKQTIAYEEEKLDFLKKEEDYIDHINELIKSNSYINNELDLAKKELSIAMCKNEMLNKKFNDMLLDEVLSSL